MKLSEFFIGKPVHWLLLAIIIGGLFWLGRIKMHVRSFNEFFFILLGIAAAVVLTIVVTHRKGDRVTRDSLDEE